MYQGGVRKAAIRTEGAADRPEGSNAGVDRNVTSAQIRCGGVAAHRRVRLYGAEKGELVIASCESEVGARCIRGERKRDIGFGRPQAESRYQRRLLRSCPIRARVEPIGNVLARSPNGGASPLGDVGISAVVGRGVVAVPSRVARRRNLTRTDNA